MNLFLAFLPFLPLASDEFCSAYLDRMLALHHEYGLPLPPPNASLVRYVAESGRAGLLFSLDGKQALGRSNEPTSVASLTIVKPDPTTLGNELIPDEIYFAIACQDRGWTELARATLRKAALQSEFWLNEDNIASHAWEYWRDKHKRDPGTPLSVIAKYLKRTPVPGDYDNAYARDFLRALELSLKPSNAPPGSDEALIDDLVELCGVFSYGFNNTKGVRYDPRYRAIIRRGFDIVPALIAHLDDARVTRIRPGDDDIEDFSVGSIAFDLLAQLSGESFLLNDKTLEARYAAVGMWFADAQKLGEEKYILSRVLGTEDDRGLKPALLWLLCEKYPERVPEVYRDLIDNHPDMARIGGHFAKAIAEGPLPGNEKHKIFEYAAKQNNPYHCSAGSKYLRAFDPKSAHRYLLAALERVPTSPNREEALPAWIVAESTDSREWQALAKVVRRTDVDGRLELLFAVARNRAPETRKLRIAFLAEYLTDDAERDTSQDQPGRNTAGNEYPQLQVRNFSALQLAIMLDIDDTPGKEWTAEQWAELREKVSKAVAKELGR
jgi:hypothetical protein